MEKVDILGVLVDKVNKDEAVEEIFKMLSEARPHQIFTPNSEIIMKAYQDEEFRGILNSADMLTADGIGVVYASKILKNPIEERTAGFDVACGVIEKIAETGHGLYLFGGKPGVAEMAKDNIEKEYPFIRIVGTHDGYFDEEDVPEIISDINRSGADILFVCLGAPAQEKWINKYKDQLKARVLMGVGGSIDVLAGVVERAPEKWCNLGLEWLYRLLKQPSRFMRMMALPKFALTVLFKGERYDDDDEEIEEYEE